MSRNPNKQKPTRADDGKHGGRVSRPAFQPNGRVDKALQGRIASDRNQPWPQRRGRLRADTAPPTNDEGKGTPKTYRYNIQRKARLHPPPTLQSPCHPLALPAAPSCCMHACRMLTFPLIRHPRSPPCPQFRYTPLSHLLVRVPLLLEDRLELRAADTTVVINVVSVERVSHGLSLVRVAPVSHEHQPRSLHLDANDRSIPLERPAHSMKNDQPIREERENTSFRNHGTPQPLTNETKRG